MKHFNHIRIVTIVLSLLALHVSLDTYGETYADVNTPGTLSSLLTDAQKDTCRSLVVSGKLNSADIRTLRQMAGYGAEGGKTGRLETLDLKDARFVTDKEPFMVLDAAKEHLAAAAAYGRIKERDEVVDIPPLQKSHAGGYGDGQRGVRQQDSPRNWDVNVMKVQEQVVQYYAPKYFLGHKNGESVTYAYPTTFVSDVRDFAAHTEARNSKGRFLFAEGISEQDWKQMKRYKITKFSGHRVYREEDGCYKISVRSCNGRFFHDTFYKCASLKTVILPVWASVDYTVVDESSSVKYVKSSPTEVRIEYTYPGWSYDCRRNFYILVSSYDTRTKVVKDRETIDSLQKLLASNAEELHGTQSLLFRLAIVMNKEGEAEEDIYLCDEKRVFHLNEGKFYAINGGLLDLFVSLKVKAPDGKKMKMPDGADAMYFMKNTGSINENIIEIHPY